MERFAVVGGEGGGESGLRLPVDPGFPSEVMNYLEPDRRCLYNTNVLNAADCTLLNGSFYVNVNFTAIKKKEDK